MVDGACKISSINQSINLPNDLRVRRGWSDVKDNGLISRCHRQVLPKQPLLLRHRCKTSRSKVQANLPHGCDSRVGNQLFQSPYLSVTHLACIFGVDPHRYPESRMFPDPPQIVCTGIVLRIAEDHPSPPPPPPLLRSTLSLGETFML